MDVKIEFTLEELKALGRVLERQYLPYDDTEVHDVVNRIFKIIRENEPKDMAR